MGAVWHEHPGALERFVGDLVADELRLLRPGGADLAPRPWPPAMSLGEDGLGMDSLERLSVASALSEALHLHESGIEDLLLARPRFGDWLQIAARGLAHFSQRMSFRTSGSSGRPKCCVHAMADLVQEAEHLATLFAGAQRVVSAVPAHHIYGFLFTVLLPQRLGGVEVVDLRQQAVPALPRHLAAGDLFVGHPAHWALVARHAAELPAGVVGVTSTAPCPADLARALTRPGALHRLVQVYGSSETAGIGWRERADDPYRLMPHWARDRQNDAVLWRRAADATREPRRVELQDRLEWQDDTRFELRGRVDAAVQVAGINVFPSRVREVLQAHPQVADAVVRPMQAHEGERLKAFIVPAAGANWDALVAELARWVQSRLSAPERPKAFTLGERLPTNTLGKACDWSIPAMASEGAGV